MLLDTDSLEYCCSTKLCTSLHFAPHLGNKEQITYSLSCFSFRFLKMDRRTHEKLTKVIRILLFFRIILPILQIVEGFYSC